VTDCLIIGYNDGWFEREVEMTRAMGLDHPDYRDLRLNFVEYQGKPYRAMDILDHFHHEGRPNPGRKLHNADVLWMVVMYLGTYLARRGFSFDYVNLFQFQKDELREKLRTGKYLTALVTTTIYNYDTPILEVVEFLRQHSPETKIVVGGPYVAKRSESMEESDLKALFKYIGADFYVRSREGEQALVRLLQALKNGRGVADVPNLAFAAGGSFVLTPTEREINPLYENLIDYSLFPREDVGSYVNVRITKGCPFTCAFCSFPLRTEKYDVSRLEYIERELNSIRDVGTVTGVFFVDDTANVPLATFKEMMRMMIRQDYGFQWHCFFRADFCDSELVDLMARAGCQGVFLGLESANDQMLINMNKTPRKSHYLEVVPLFKRAGIKVFASLFFGFPGETHATAQETMDFLVETRPDYYRPLIWYCDPVTPIWKERDKYGLKGYHFSWSHDTMDVSTACDLVERCFFTFDTPLWVPDPGFNFVSLFLLQNRGLSFDQIDTFLRCFNAVVREQVVEPARPETSPHLIENLRRACQYDRPASPELRTLEVFSADRYVAAERFWLAEFADAPAAGGSKARRPHEAPDSPDAWSPGPPLPLARPLVERLETATGAERHSVLLAALAAALLRLGGPEDRAVVAAVDDREPYPVRLAAAERMAFRDLACAARRKLADGLPHRRFASTVVSGVFRMPGYLRVSPRFDVGYLDDGGLQRFAGAAYRELELILRVAAGKDGCTLQFLSSPGEWTSERIECLGEALLQILRLAAEQPDVSLGDIPLASLARPTGLPGGPLGALEFNF
jgi:radical SAM PhpK family P-methyltransferase